MAAGVGAAGAVVAGAAGVEGEPVHEGTYPPHLLVQWHVTERCNLRCAHCYQEGYRGEELGFQGLLDILAQFLIEAVVLSLLGGLVGIVVGAGAARLVERIGDIITVVSPQSVLLAVGFSVAVGLFFGIYPAARAAALNPIEALRYE